MSPLLMAYEKDCQASRWKAPDIRACLNDATLKLGHTPDPVFAAVNQKIIDLLEIDAQTVEHAYHNRHHVCDVLSAVVLLLRQTDLDEKAITRLADCMITAALGHDLHHDGRGTISELDVERRSAAAVCQRQPLPRLRSGELCWGLMPRYLPRFANSKSMILWKPI